MILVDTSVWVDHLRETNPVLATQLRAGHVLAHPFVIGELALGSLRQRQTVLRSLQELPQAIVAQTDEVLVFVERQNLAASGIGYVDAHLLASVALTANARLWTRDKRLSAVATELGLSAHPAS